MRVFVFIMTVAFFSNFTAINLHAKDINKPIKKNIIIIAIDALRPDHLGCYGYNRNTSPNIDKLAGEGIRFTQAIAPGGWTFESVPSILTGTYSFVHQICGSSPAPINHNIKTLPQELSTHNYQTAIFSNQPVLKIIDTSNYFQELFLDKGTLDHKATITEYSLTNNIQAWLGEKGTEAPFFLYIHYWGCHVPYRPPAPYKDMFSHDRYSKKHKTVPISTLNTEDRMFDGKGRIPYVLAENNITDMHYYIAQYDGVISYVDSQIGRLMGTLKKLKLYKDTVIILISDHGEMLGEHNMYFFHTGGYEENIRVPLIIRFPKLFPGGKKVSTQVSLIDIAPTILEIIGLTKPSYMQGESLLSFVKPFRSYNAKYALSSDRDFLTVRSGDWKLFYNGRDHSYDLFDLKNVPKEENNLIYQRTDVVKLLARRMAEWRDKKNSSDLKGRRLLLENDKEILRSLGYIQ